MTTSDIAPICELPPKRNSELTQSALYFNHYSEVETLSKAVLFSNGSASETKANESFDNGVSFDIEAKRTPSIVSKLFSKRSEHIR